MFLEKQQQNPIEEQVTNIDRDMEALFNVINNSSDAIYDDFWKRGVDPDTKGKALGKDAIKVFMASAFIEELKEKIYSLQGIEYVKKEVPEDFDIIWNEDGSIKSIIKKQVVEIIES